MKWVGVIYKVKLKVNKKLHQQHLSTKSDKVVTLRDISNIQSEVNKSSDSNDLEALVSRLRSIEGNQWQLSVCFVITCIFV